MPNILSHDSYGKSQVRLTKVTRQADRHELLEVSVDIELQGDFARSYSHGDNASLIATDTMKNTVYALAKELQFSSIEHFGQLIASHFIANNTHVRQATVRMSESPFQRIKIDGKPHPHAFVGGRSERRTATVAISRNGIAITSGIDGLLILKTTGSAFKGFIRDKYTTLRETSDRIFATILKMDWTCGKTTGTDFNAVHQKARDASLRVFAETFSDAVQQTLFQIGDAVLKACPEIELVELAMPNKHRVLADLQPFGLSNENEIFITTDEPFGLIRGTVKRG